MTCGVYVQADEALHEDDHPALRASLARLHAEPRAEGLLFEYVHFYGSFHTVGVSRRWYRHEIRAVKLGVGVRSWRDAQGFRVVEGGGARKLRVLPSGARMYHYGWVRSPEDMWRKNVAFQRLVHRRPRRAARGGAAVRVRHDGEGAPLRGDASRPDAGPRRARRLALRAPTALAAFAHLREDLLDLFERATGVRIGEYRNYRRLPP